MCLGIPGRVEEIHEEAGLPMARVAFGSVRRTICLAYVADEVEPGDYVVVHVGFAISRIDEEEARRTFEILQEMSALEELDWMEATAAPPAPPRTSPPGEEATP